MTFDLFELRRELHRHPEVAFTEFWTAAFVARRLRELGFQVRVGADAIDPEARLGVPLPSRLVAAAERAISEGADRELVGAMAGGLTGVLAEKQGKRPGLTVGFRFDMDALAIPESSEQGHVPHELGFASLHPGNMHACGHDAHTAVGLVLAERLADGDFEGTIRLIFQPAEEGAGGARAMVAAGAVNGVNRLFCFHFGLGLPLGEIAASTTGFLATTKLEATFTGRGAHAGQAPEYGRNALLAAATALLAVHAIPRFNSADTRVNVGLLEGGGAVNVVPARARMLIETRASQTAVDQELVRRVERILVGAAAMYEVEVQSRVIGVAEVATSDPSAAAAVMEAARNLDDIGELRDSYPFGASEDASLLMRAVQEAGGTATYFLVGTTLAAPHHNERFDIDEESMPTALDLLEAIARRPSAVG